MLLRLFLTGVFALFLAACSEQSEDKTDIKDAPADPENAQNTSDDELRKQAEREARTKLEAEEEVRAEMEAEKKAEDVSGDEFAGSENTQAAQEPKTEVEQKVEQVQETVKEVGETIKAVDELLKSD